MEFISKEWQIMKPAKRLIAGALSLLLMCSLCLTSLPVAKADAGQSSGALTGSIGLTLRFDLPQTKENAAGRNITLQVSGGGKNISVPLPGGTADIPVEVDNRDGVPLTNEAYVGYYKVELNGLPAGETYQITLTGNGYKAFHTSTTLDGYSKHLIVGTGDGTFSLGDVDGNGEVNQADLTAMDARLGGNDAAFDLDGDGKVDITDLTYVNHNVGVSGSAKVLDTAAIVFAELQPGAFTLENGSEADLFRDEGEVKLVPAEGVASLTIPVVLGTAMEISEISITCPDAEGAIQKGQVLVEPDGGSAPFTVSFDAAPSAQVHAIGRTTGERVITIDLGRRVAVKKVTITVTATQSNSGFAVVRKIEFLKDIVPDNPKSELLRILSTVPGNGQVTLAWTAVNNITGYVIRYGTGDKLDQEMPASSTQATVTGLENLKEYRFQVIAVNEEWSSDASPVVSAIPQPSSPPGAPSNISVTPADGSLRVSWGKTKDAAYYQLFYRKSGQSSFTQYGGDLSGTSAIITGLANDVAYQVAVKAGNNKGTGPYSATASGTPHREELAMPELPAEDRIDNSMIESVVMANPNNVDTGLCPNFAPTQVADGNAATYWVAHSWSWDSHFTFTFKQPQDMDYVVLVPYLAGNYKYALRSYTVTAKDSQDNVLLRETLYYAPSMDPQKNYLVLPFTLVKGVSSLSISLNEREGNGCRVSISELAFYTSDGLTGDIANLFTDGSFSALRDGVTQEQIDGLSARLDARPDFYLSFLRDELALAQSLLNKEQNVLGVVKSGFRSRGSGLDKEYGQSASDLQPLGVTVRAGTTVAVYAQLPTDEPVYVVPTQYFGESGIWRGTAIRLVNGRNYITVPQIGSLDDPRGGPLYLTYAGSHPEAIKIHIRTGDNAFAMPVLELSGWYGMTEAARRSAIETYVNDLQAYVGTLASAGLATDVRNATEISTPSVLLSIPASQALAGLNGKEDKVQALYDNVLAWENVLFVANKVQGIIPSDMVQDNYQYPMTTRQNIRYMRMFAGAFMYAAGNHVGVGWGSTTGLVCGRPVSKTGEGNSNGLFGWGIAHEIGHNMDKLGKAEITNNIYSLAVQAYDGGSMALPTRLTLSNIWKGVYDKTSAGRPGSAGNVFVQLGMYWQLHLAYDNADGPLDFYNRFFTAWKSGRYSSGYTYDERVALIASETANKNLIPFFTHWGMTLGEDAVETIKKLSTEERAIWYLNDGSYAARLSGAKAAEMSAEVSATVEENQVILTIACDNKDVLGYEIRRDGKPIAFAVKASGGEATVYTDDLGPANSLTYTYSVIPVDQLGYMGKETVADEVRVAYDKTIDNTQYTESAGDGYLEFTMKNGPVSVTGVKIAGEELSGDYTVEIKNGGSQWTVVKTGELSGQEAVVYFTKPGADPAADSRIWTYDVTAVRVTLSQEAAGVRIALLDYPGDRVDFYEGAVAGTLAQDYTYTDADNQTQTIKAGTLVIVGTYRGDPGYNYVEIEGRYDTTPEAKEEEADGTAQIERPMNGYSLLFAEIPEDGEVSDISNGFWLFVPDLEAEKELIQATTGQSIPQGAVTRLCPMEIRALLRRTDIPDSAVNERNTSRTLWVTFPDYDNLPQISLTADGAAQ